MVEMVVSDIIEKHKKLYYSLEEAMNNIDNIDFDEGLKRWKDYFGFLTKKVKFIE